jgi:hypothetical protein
VRSLTGPAAAEMAPGLAALVRRGEGGRRVGGVGGREAQGAGVTGVARGIRGWCVISFDVENDFIP